VAERREETNMPGEAKRGKRSASRALPGILAALLFLAAALGGFVFRELSLIRRPDPAAEPTLPPAEESFEADPDSGEDTILPEEIRWETPAPAAGKSELINILLIGQDRRPGEGRARSDSMILCSINKETDRITLVSLMRDMYVPIPGYSDNRINAAYAFGGMELLSQVIEQDLGLLPDGCVEVDFDGFLRVMAAAAPLEIELNAAEAGYLNAGTGSNLTEGIHPLNEEQLLTYARMRSVGRADYERTERQRRVLTAAFQKLRTRPITELFTMAEEVLPCITTNLDNTEILNLIFLVVSRHMTMGESRRIPADGTYTPQTIRGMSVLVPDLGENSRLLQEYINEINEE